jgi:hypothetical protein
MKNLPVLLLLFGASLMPAYLHAQHISDSVAHVRIQENTTRIRAMLQRQEDKKQARHSAAKSTSALAERLISYSEYDFWGPDSFTLNNGLRDTSSFKYSGDRGSRFNYNTIAYDYIRSTTGFYNFGGGSFANMLARGFVSTSDHPNFRPDIQCDSSFRIQYAQWDTAGTITYALGPDSTYQLFDVQNNLTAYVVSNFSAIIFGYDGSNNNVVEKGMNFNTITMVYDTLYVCIHVFDGLGRLIEDSLSQNTGIAGILTPSSKWLYSYDGSGNLVHSSSYWYAGGSWQEEQRSEIKYNTDNTIKTDSLLYLNTPAGLWVTGVVDSFGYTPGATCNTYMRTDYYSNSTSPMFAGSDIIWKHVNVAGLPDTIYASQTRLYFPPYNLYLEYKAAITYDAFRNPVTVYKTHFNVSDSTTGAGSYGPVPDDITHYYYETYTSSVAVKDITSSQNASIYPNPAANEVFITLPATATPANISLLNALGQPVKTQLLTTASGTISLPLNEVLPGIYLLKITDKNGSLLSTQKIIKQ